MNDFTKEELYDLKYAIKKVRQPTQELVFSNLRDKIQSMIDNYCKHGYMSGKRGVITCDDCGKVL